MSVAPMTSPGQASEFQTRSCMVNQMGGLLHLGGESYFLNPAGYDFKTCILSKLPCTKCCFSFTPTLVYTNPSMTKGVEFKKTTPCCAKPRYEVLKLEKFQTGSGAQEKTLMAYTWQPEPPNPCWWRCCCYPVLLGGTLALATIPPFVCVPVFLALLGSGSKGSYGVLCTNETIEYGIKHGADDSVLYTFQNDKSGFEKLCCCGMAPPQDDKCANCTALKNLEMYRNVHRTFFDQNSKEGTHRDQPPRQSIGEVQRTSVMLPTLRFPHICCCAEEVGAHPLGALSINTPGAKAEDDLIRMSLIMYAANAGWTLIDYCLDSDPAVRHAMTVPVNSKGDDPKVHARVDYSDFGSAIAKGGIIDTGDLIPKMQEQFK